MRVSPLLLTAILLPLLTSCGGGDTQVAEGGIGGTGVSQGKVSGYGSIFVNGVEFVTDGAEFLIEETSGSGEEAIKLGMVVQVTGDHDGVSGTANSVTYSNQLKGVISGLPSLDLNGNGTLPVMQQTVYVNQTTIFEDATIQGLLITDLAENDLVEVSGFSDGQGTIYATRVELASRNWTTGTTLAIKGVVTNLTNTQFNIGGLTIDFSNATSLPDGPPVADSYVEVKGNSFNIDGEFEASEVELEGDGNLTIAADGDQVTAEGIVTSPVSSDLFSLNGQWISIANLEAVDLTQFTDGRELSVTGVMAGGVIEASEITFSADISEQQEMAYLVEGVQVADINTGTLTLLGQQISVTPFTLMKDDLGDDRNFSLSVLSAFDYVEVDVYHDGNGWVALKLERESAPTELVAEVEGLVQEINVDGVPNQIRVLGVLIDISGTGINPAVGDRVDMSGSYDGTILTATKGEEE